MDFACSINRHLTKYLDNISLKIKNKKSNNFLSVYIRLLKKLDIKIICYIFIRGLNKIFKK